MAGTQGGSTQQRGSTRPLPRATYLYDTLGVRGLPNAVGTAVGLGCFPSALQGMVQWGAAAAEPQEAQ